MQKEWLLQGEFSPEQRQQIKALTERLKCPRLVAELLFRKGLDTPDQIEDFFQPQLGHQHDPFLFPDMGKAVDRILSAIDRGERITIYGD